MPKKKIIKPDFYIIPRQVADDERTHPMDEKIYAIVYWFERLKDGECRAGNTTIAEIAMCDPKSVKNSLTRLEQCGYIVRTYKDKAKRNRTSIHTKVAYGVEGNADDSQKTREMPMTHEGNASDSAREMSVTRISNSKEVIEKSKSETPGEYARRFFEDEEEQEKMLAALVEAGMSRSKAEHELNKFISYWTEPTKSGKKQLWETKQTFEVKRRIGTWMRNAVQFASNRRQGRSPKGIKI